MTTVYQFPGGTNGGAPKGTLVQGKDGNFYGTTSGAGTVFKIAPDGTFTTLHTLSSAEGVSVFGTLVLGNDGNFYGTTAGSVPGAGTVYKITTGGTFTTLHTFNVTDGNAPWCGLALGADGNFYGTTSSGGQQANGIPSATGTVFKITASGAFTKLHDFSIVDGNSPRGALALGPDGSLYGTTTAGGDNSRGTVFKITPGGTFTTLHSFSAAEGGDPWDQLLPGPDGNFYGTTLAGASGPGTVFQITPAGTFKTLHSFNGQDGADPIAGLALGPDGSFYGTTQDGGTGTVPGTLFKITAGGTFTTLHSFSGLDDGAYPYGGLTLGSDGNFHGTTDGGGKNGAGTVFTLSLGGGAATGPSISAGGVLSAGAFGQFSSVAPGSWVEIYGSNLASGSRSWIGSDFIGINAPTSLDKTTVTIGGQAAFIDYISPSQVNVQVPSNVGGGQQSLIVTTPSGASPAYTVTVNGVQPGLLAPPSFNIGGKQYATALFPDASTFVLPPGAIPGLASRRAQPGDTITFYGIGFGSVTPDTPAGQVVQQPNVLALPFHLFFGSTEAIVKYAGLAPEAIGLYQFNMEVPNVPAADLVPLTFTLGGISGTQTLYVAVQ